MSERRSPRQRNVQNRTIKGQYRYRNRIKSSERKKRNESKQLNLHHSYFWSSEQYYLKTILYISHILSIGSTLFGMSNATRC